MTDTGPATTGDAVAAAHAALLPLLPRAVERYRALAGLPGEDEAKLAAAQQQACKAALAHVEALIKLLRLSAPPGDPGGGSGDDGLVARARDAFDSYRGDDA